MGLLGELFLDAILMTALIVGGVYITRADKLLGDDNTTDPAKGNSRKLLTYNSIITWVGAFLIIGALVVYVIFGGETAEYTGKWVLLITGLLILGVIATQATLASISWYRLWKAGFHKSDRDMFKDLTIGVCISLGATLFALIKLLIGIFKKKKK